MTLTQENRPVVKKTPNVDKFIDLLTEYPSLTGEKDLSSAADPVTRSEMAEKVVTCARNGNGRVNDCLMAVCREVPAGTKIAQIVDGVLERAVAA